MKVCKARFALDAGEKEKVEWRRCHHWITVAKTKRSLSTYIVTCKNCGVVSSKRVRGRYVPMPTVRSQFCDGKKK